MSLSMSGAWCLLQSMPSLLALLCPTGLNKLLHCFVLHATKFCRIARQAAWVYKPWNEDASGFRYLDKYPRNLKARNQSLRGQLLWCKCPSLKEWLCSAQLKVALNLRALLMHGWSSQVPKSQKHVRKACCSAELLNIFEHHPRQTEVKYEEPCNSGFGETGERKVINQHCARLCHRSARPNFPIRIPYIQ